MNAAKDGGDPFYSRGPLTGSGPFSSGGSDARRLSAVGPERVLGSDLAAVVGVLGVLDQHDGVHLVERGLPLAGTVAADLGHQVVRRPVAAEGPHSEAAGAPRVVVAEHVQQLALDVAVVRAAPGDRGVRPLEGLVQAREVGVVLHDRREHGARLGRTAVVAALHGVVHRLGEAVALGLGDASHLADLDDAVREVVLVVQVLRVETGLLLVPGVGHRVVHQEADQQREHECTSGADGDDRPRSELAARSGGCGLVSHDVWIPSCEVALPGGASAAVPQVAEAASDGWSDSGEVEPCRQKECEHPQEEHDGSDADL